MPRYNYEIVRNIINEKSNGECKLISKEYINDRTPLLLQCKCGNVFQRTFNKLKNSQYICKDCIHKNFSKNYSLNFDYVLEEIKKGGCEYISGEYVNSKSKLKLKCSCGMIFEKDFSHFKLGQKKCPKCGKESSKKSKFKYDLNSVKKILSEKGYTLLEEKYINSSTPMKCLCKNGHNVEIKLTYFFKKQSGCKICAAINSSGKNHWNYKGGENELTDFLRKSLKKWKKEILKRDNYQCVISKSNKNLKVHHLISFSTLMNETLSELNLPLHRKLKDYKAEELNKILNLFLQKHTLNIGVTLTNTLHRKFHTLYGIKNNTLEQFKEFCQHI